jgi:Flp pilus assembly protein TadB
MPPLLALFMFWMDPSMMGHMLSEPIGRIMLVAAGILEIIGILVFRRLIQVRY